MNQTRMGSLIESLTNIVLGIGVALGSQLLIFPLFNIHVPISTNLWITLWFTVISVIRSYLIRRFFNGRIKILSQSIAGHFKGDVS